MKKTKAPQFEFGFPAEPFALVAESAADGESVTRSRRETEDRRAEFEAAQPDLVPVNQSQTP